MNISCFGWTILIFHQFLRDPRQPYLQWRHPWFLSPWAGLQAAGEVSAPGLCAPFGWFHVHGCLALSAHHLPCSPASQHLGPHLTWSGPAC